MSYKNYKSALAVFIAGSIMGCAQPNTASDSPPANNILLAISSDFSTGMLQAISPDGSKVYRNVTPASGDAVIRHTNDQTIILNRSAGSSALFLADDYSPLAETAIGTNANPQDIVWDGSCYRVVALDLNKVLCINENFARVPASDIDLSAYADADGYAELAAVYADVPRDRLYVTAQRLDRNAGSAVWPPAGNSYLIEIRSSDGSVIAAHNLPFSNPLGRIRTSGRSNPVIVMACPGNYGFNYSLDGGVVEFDLISRTFLPAALTEAALGREITAVTIVDDSLGYILAANDSFDSYVIRFDPDASPLATTIIASMPYSEGGYFSSLEVNPQYLYIADRKVTDPRIRRFDLLSGIELSSRWEGLPPFDLLWVP